MKEERSRKNEEMFLEDLFNSIDTIMLPQVYNQRGCQRVFDDQVTAVYCWRARACGREVVEQVALA